MKLKQRQAQRKNRHALNVQGRKRNADKGAKEVIATVVESLKPIQPAPVVPAFKKTPPIQKLRAYLKEKFGF